VGRANRPRQGSVAPDRPDPLRRSSLWVAFCSHRSIFTTQEGSESFWEAQISLMELLNTAPGFMRSHGFGDGPNNTLRSTARRCATSTSSAGSTATSPPSGR